MNPFKFLLKLSVSIFIFWCFSLVSVNATPVTLGKYPVCEPSAVVKVTCPELGGNCLLVGDNEQNEALFLYKVSSNGLDSNRQRELALEKKISDIEAIAKLDDNKVLIFGSHSRNSKCEVKTKRQRFLQAKLSGNQLETIGELVKSPQINSKVLFGELDLNNNKVLSMVSRAIDEAEKKADEAMILNTDDQRKKACQEANAFNAEGAVTVPHNSSVSKVWIGLRSPLVSQPSLNYAILLRMANPDKYDKYQFDGAALLDLEGRGIRELTFAHNWIWGIAGGPKDGQDNFKLWRISAESLKPNTILKPEIVRVSEDGKLPPSSEGLAIVDETAYVLIDGDSGDSGNQCETQGKFIQFAFPD